MNTVNYFRFVRDIPYKIPISENEADYCCSGKHKVLYQLLKSLKLKVRYRVCEFLWSSVNLPKEVVNIFHQDLSTHTYLEVFIQARGWIVVDSTWDERLSKLFQINEWDGKNNTVIAVKPVRIYSPAESKRYVETESVDDVTNDLKINGKFYDAINKWLEKIRAQS